MGKLTLAQAIQTAIDAERSAVKFYSRLARNTNNSDARQLLQDLCKDEQKHEERLLELAQDIGNIALPEVGMPLAESIETRRDYLDATDLTYEQSLEVALEGERNAMMLYDALADGAPVAVQTFFRELSAVEGEHARKISSLLAEIRKAGK
jgi:rubrerythrin